MATNNKTLIAKIVLRVREFGILPPTMRQSAIEAATEEILEADRVCTTYGEMLRLYEEVTEELGYETL